MSVEEAEKIQVTRGKNWRQRLEPKKQRLEHCDFEMEQNTSERMQQILQQHQEKKKQLNVLFSQTKEAELAI